MDYEPLHHKYRPQAFAELVGQRAIATTLTNALKQNRIAPAYLFCGPRGTGKTSSARILAKSLNCLSSPGPTPTPCGHCQACQEITAGIALDVVEVDAASNTGVDNIRELIERAQFAPVQCRYKLFVLDEVHMLSTAAFNSLLKTLEEPPAQVVFVLATTDPQRVLPTIISRCQRFDFRRIPLEPMVQHLGNIAQTESITLTPEALTIVAQLSQGGLRDAQSLLDQLGLLDGEITVEDVWELVGAVPERDLLALTQAIFADDGTVLLEQARALMDRGREPLIVLQGLVAFYRDLLIAQTASNRQDLVAITPTTWADMVAFAQTVSLSTLLAGQQHLKAAEVQIKNTTQPRLWLEITLLGLLPSALGAAPSAASHPPAQPAPLSSARPVASNPGSKSSTVPAPTAPAASSPSPTPSVIPAAPAAAAPAPDPKPRKPEHNKPEHNKPEHNKPEHDKPEPPSPVTPPPHPAATGSLSDIWKKVLRVVEPRATQMLMNQQGKLLGLDGVTARVGFRSQRLFKLAQERVDNLTKAFEQVFGYRIKVVLEVLDEPLPPPQTPPSAAASPSPPVNSPPITPDDGSPPPQSFSAPPPLSPSPPDSSPPPPPDSGATPSPMAWQSESELDRSAKRLAEFFNGQVINLSEDSDSPQATPASPQNRPPQNRPTSPPPNTAPGPDVPF
ncbi:MAG: DNA polymerase III subunit gamma/tau [Cyanobacteria bacterium P01_A01_bin.105]